MEKKQARRSRANNISERLTGRSEVTSERESVGKYQWDELQRGATGIFRTLYIIVIEKPQCQRTIFFIQLNLQEIVDNKKLAVQSS